MTSPECSDPEGEKENEAPKEQHRYEYNNTSDASYYF